MNITLRYVFALNRHIRHYLLLDALPNILRERQAHTGSTN